MSNFRITLFFIALFSTTIAMGNNFSSEVKKQDITEVMTAVANWQIDNFKAVRHHDLDWTNGALYSGMMNWSQVSKDKKYEKWLMKIGWKYKWQPYFRMYHADDVVVSQMFLDMYRVKKDKRMLQPTQSRLDFVISHPSKGSLTLNYRDYTSLERWSWCDALFMAPPVYAKMASITGEKKYMKFMHKEFLATYDFLYDADEHLFFRDANYFDKKEANGEKIFWGRGNGWVMGGLVAILKELPAKSKYRKFYEKLFKEMAAKVANLQDEKGYWHASMLDYDSYPNGEMSCSSFFTYALAYGVNSGLLDKATYLPKVKKGWNAMVNSVLPNGKLGWVQPIGQDPKKVTKDMTEVYGVGAFLLAGCEILKL
ncbi:glycoside hydrolase family 88 protein [Prolixibacteraceae bacterium JC049]|nr:glycoside hydrolase family 88 protein [Prolixibacteraceae bacterium JC049]